MELQLAFVCADARLTETGQLDATGIFNDLYAPGFPAMHRMVLVGIVEWGELDRGRYNFRVDLVGPESNTALTIEGHTEVPSHRPDEPPRRTRLILPLDEVVFEMAGVYRFRFRIKGTELEGPSLWLARPPQPG